MIDWINKHLTHNRDEVGDYGIRLVIHIPHGLIMSIPILGWSLIPIFMAYQKSESYYTADQGWKDHAGAITGIIIGVLVQIAVGIALAVILL